MKASIARFNARLGSPANAVINPDVPNEPGSREALALGVVRKVDHGWEHVGVVYAATSGLIDALGLDAADVAARSVVTSLDATSTSAPPGTP